jgi:hypothetical protein
VSVRVGSCRFMSVCVGSCRFVSVRVGSCPFVSVRVSSCRFVSVHVGSCRFVSVVRVGSCRFVSVRVGSCRFVSVRVGSCQFVSVRVGSCRFVSVRVGSCWFVFLVGNVGVASRRRDPPNDMSSRHAPTYRRHVENVGPTFGKKMSSKHVKRHVAEDTEKTFSLPDMNDMSTSCLQRHFDDMSSKCPVVKTCL